MVLSRPGHREHQIFVELTKESKHLHPIFFVLSILKREVPVIPDQSFKALGRPKGEDEWAWGNGMRGLGA